MFCKVFIRPWLEYHTSSILLCSHGTYCLNRVYTQKTFNLSRLALSIIIFLTLFRVGFLHLLTEADKFSLITNDSRKWIHVKTVTHVKRVTQYLVITRYFYCCNECSCQFLRCYFRDMSHLRESLNDLLRSNFIASYNSYKKGRRE